jgi:hypothetical protein
MVFVDRDHCIDGLGRGGRELAAVRAALLLRQLAGLLERRGANVEADDLRRAALRQIDRALARAASEIQHHLVPQAIEQGLTEQDFELRAVLVNLPGHVGRFAGRDSLEHPVLRCCPPIHASAKPRTIQHTVDARMLRRTAGLDLTHARFSPGVGRKRRCRGHAKPAPCPGRQAQRQNAPSSSLCKNELRISFRD